MGTMVSDKGAGDYERAPTGMQAAVCSHVVDLGLQPGGQFKPAEKVALCFELKALMSDGRPFMLSNMYTKSLNEKANLRKDLIGWRGKDFSEEELAGFDLDKVLGANCLLNVVEAKKGDKTYSNIAAILPKAQGSNLVPVGQPAPEWLRKLAEMGKANLAANQENGGAPNPAYEDDGSLPF